MLEQADFFASTAMVFLEIRASSVHQIVQGFQMSLVSIFFRL